MESTSGRYQASSEAETDALATVSEPAATTSKRRFDRRQLLGIGIGALAAAKVVSSSSHAHLAKASANTDGQTNVLASQAGTVTLSFMRFAGPQWEADTKFVNEFMAANPNIKVEAQDVIYDQMFNKCLAQGGTNSLADVFAGHNIWAPYLAYKGLSYDLDDAFNTGKITDPSDFFPSVIADARHIGVDGKLFWIPTVVHPAGNAVIIFNMDLMNTKQVMPPADKNWTIDDFGKIIQAAADPDKKIRGTDINLYHPLYTQQYTRSWGSDPVNGSEDAWLLSADGKRQQLDSAPVKTALEWFHTFVKAGQVPTSGERSALTGTGIDMFSAGMLASTAGTVGQVANYAATVGGRFEMQSVLWPLGPYGHRGDCLSYNTQSVWSKTQHPDEAIALANYITGPEPALWTGLEGTLHCMARHSAWFSPELWAKYPVMQDAAAWF